MHVELFVSGGPKTLDFNVGLASHGAVRRVVSCTTVFSKYKVTNTRLLVMIWLAIHWKKRVWKSTKNAISRFFPRFHARNSKCKENGAKTRNDIIACLNTHSNHPRFCAMIMLHKRLVFRTDMAQNQYLYTSMHSCTNNRYEVNILNRYVLQCNVRTVIFLKLCVVRIKYEVVLKDDSSYKNKQPYNRGFSNYYNQRWLHRFIIVLKIKNALF